MLVLVVERFGPQDLIKSIKGLVHNGLESQELQREFLLMDQEIPMLLTNIMKFLDGMHPKITLQSCQGLLWMLELALKVIFGLSELVQFLEEMKFFTR